MSLRNDLIKFFQDNPNPKDFKVHDLADKLEVNAHELETEIYKLVTEYVTGAFIKHGDDPDSDFDADQLKMAAKVELEHSDDPILGPVFAPKIGKGHLAEIEDYYTRLDKMEGDAPKKKSKSEALLEMVRGMM